MSQPLEEMQQPVEEMQPETVWCGRSWEGLVDRRREALKQALSLQNVTQNNARDRLESFLDFFDTIGVDLMRDEEQWIFEPLRPAPTAVMAALEEHLAISLLVRTLLGAAQDNIVDPAVLRRLGEMLLNHLLMEEAEIRPLVRLL